MDIRHDEERSRFVLESDGRAAVLSYLMRGDDRPEYQGLISD